MEKENAFDVPCKKSNAIMNSRAIAASTTAPARKALGSELRAWLSRRAEHRYRSHSTELPAPSTSQRTIHDAGVSGVQAFGTHLAR